MDILLTQKYDDSEEEEDEMMQQIYNHNLSLSSIETQDEGVMGFNNNNVNIGERFNYVQKPLVSFLTPADMEEYTNFLNKPDSKIKKKKHHDYKFIKAFHLLYKEYKFVCQVCLPNSCSNTNVDLSIRPTFFENNLTSEMTDSTQIDNAEIGDFDRKISTTKNNNQDQSSVVINVCQTPTQIGDKPDDIKNSPLPKPSISMFTGLKDAFRISKGGWLKRNHKSNKPFDRIRRFQKLSIEVYEDKKSCAQLTHRISYSTKNNKNSMTTKWVQVPIALELLLPKVQEQIEEVMVACNFLCDPLEVVAELRSFNYNVADTISYFNATRNIRDVIEEFIPSDGDPNSLTVTDIANDTNIWFKTAEMAKESDPEYQVIPLTIEEAEPNMNTVVKENITETIKQTMSMDETTDVSSKDNTSLALVRNNHVTRGECATCLTVRLLPQFGININTAKGDTFRQLMISVLEDLEEVKMARDDLKKELTRFQNGFYRSTTAVKDILTAHVKHAVKTKNSITSDTGTTSNVTDQQRRNKTIVLARQVEELRLKLKEEERKRRQIHNLMQEQLGNIRVYCRCRDVEKRPSQMELRSNDTIAIATYQTQPDIYTFEKVFAPGAPQESIFKEFRSLIDSFIDGFNVSFITYGGEASGKTYTLIGAPGQQESQQGLIYRALTTVLQEKKNKTRDWDYSLSTVAVEIYNETYVDFLGEKQSPVDLYVDHGLEMVFQKLTNMRIETLEDVENLLTQCREKRKTARTALNPASSRSHLICLFRLHGHSRIHGEQFISFLSQMDLAGFEDIIKAETHKSPVLTKEASYINKSLTAFNRVFMSLKSQDPANVSYRDTKLTHLMKPFLTNSGKCAIIVTVRTDKDSLSSSQNTLRFGKDTRNVTLGKAKRQSINQAIINRLTSTTHNLREAKTDKNKEEDSKPRIEGRIQAARK